jgi:hypothetical protein
MTTSSFMNPWTLAVALAALAAPAAAAELGVSDAEIRRMMIRDSHAAYSGPCRCPYDAMKNGRACGPRSAYSKPGGRSPLCYAEDISQKMVDDYRAAHRLPR